MVHVLAPGWTTRRIVSFDHVRTRQLETLLHIQSLRTDADLALAPLLNVLGCPFGVLRWRGGPHALARPQRQDR